MICKGFVTTMSHVSAPCLLDRWIEENNAIVDKWKQHSDRGDAVTREQGLTLLKWCYVESHKLLQKIQGVPAVPAHVQLELTVVYNCCLFSFSQTQFTEAEHLLTHSLERALGAVGCDRPPPEPRVFWCTVLKSLGSTSSLRSCTLQLLCLHWALWLSTCRLGHIQELQEELRSLSEGLGAGERDDRRAAGEVAMEMSAVRPAVLVHPRDLKDLLLICTVIAQGAGLLCEGQCSEALTVLQRDPSPLAPRDLLAQIHTLTGLCLSRTGRPHSAVQCYRKALETDVRCVCALHQSILVYRQLGNTQAEIQALRLLHSVLMMPPATHPAVAPPPIVCPASLLPGQSLSSLLSVPSPLSVLHSLAQKCVLHGSVSEGVEHYLDLLAFLQSDHQLSQGFSEAPPLPRLPELYLEAGSSLLTAQRPADCLALCDEVISTTLELLPERLLLEEPMEASVHGSPDKLGLGQDRLGVVLWSGAAYLLQAHCYSHLKDWKQAVTHYTRCINLLMKVCIKQKGCVKQELGVRTLQRLKGLALAGRGISFTHRDQKRESLRDLQLSLQAAPGCVSAGQWLTEVLWRLGRKQEAAACWEKTQSSSTAPSLEGVPLYLVDRQTGPSLDLTDLRRRVEEFTNTQHS
ncbi:Fanconi anemia group G protein [Coregonus clupeaformis]|uniref:Fanconi anemia group G protein n=1 Tax=Coregonus clupeaformis TaxID=59861 RepID=UPI001BE12B36|nr:Fanconi anemia group G protein [Coregonus clupeaformis]